ncbi:MAG TPA: 5-(carboxyamino)imidazole ribonucleotide synthase [Phycisphaerales bacterium]|nr:5-(carboxyamino)imidazole ribonucleotide synthase [Phycisphaerales bacterium]
MLIGVLGAGQLGRMLALAGIPLGVRFRFLDPTPDSPAGHVSEQIVGGFEDPGAVKEFCRGLDIATWEFENVPVAAARRVAEQVPMFPPPVALEVGQDRLHEKLLFREMGLEVHPFGAASTFAEFEAVVAQVGIPAVVKTRRGGYDGKGQALLREGATRADIAQAWESLGGVPVLVEKFVPFERELSIIGVRARTGELCAYPLTQNVHRAGILRVSTAPCEGWSRPLQERAERYARALMERLNYVGVLAIEFFEVGGALLANEMAPRVHNSGHWTIEGAETSQFENHVRAVAGLPLGRTTPRGHSVMVNLIGNAPTPRAVLEVDRAHLHLYGKSPRSGRKIGHVTVNGPTAEAVAAPAERIRAMAADASGEAPGR